MGLPVLVVVCSNSDGATPGWIAPSYIFICFVVIIVLSRESAAADHVDVLNFRQLLVRP